MTIGGKAASLVILAGLLTLPGLAQAQSAIGGVVKDTSGAILPGVTYSTQPGTGFTSRRGLRWSNGIPSIGIAASQPAMRRVLSGPETGKYRSRNSVSPGPSAQVMRRSGAPNRVGT